MIVSPVGHKEVVGITRGHLHTLAPGNKEPAQLETLMEMEEKEASEKAQKKEEPHTIGVVGLELQGTDKGRNGNVQTVQDANDKRHHH